jgi:hypothetical protein
MEQQELTELTKAGSGSSYQTRKVAYNQLSFMLDKEPNLMPVMVL